MKAFITFVLVMCCASASWAESAQRYVPDEKVFFEDPQEEDVLKVNLSFGFLTVLEFPEKPVMVAVGDDSLIQIEVPDNSRNVVIKPLEESGVTNLFVFTPGKRFNYQVLIGQENHADYVVDVNVSFAPANSSFHQEEVSLNDLIKMTRDYFALKELGNINEKKLKNKRLFQVCSHPKVDVLIKDVFQYTTPNYVIVNFSVTNGNYKEITITENNTKLVVNDQEFMPEYVFFDQTTLEPKEKTEGWLFLKDTYISLSNKFQIIIGAGDERYKCR